MEIIEIFPVLIPGALLQLSIQIYYIIKCLRDNKLTKTKQFIYAVMIAIFNLPAAAVYLFKSSNKDSDMSELSKNVAPNIRKGIFLLLVVAYEVMGLHMLAENISNPYYFFLTILLLISLLLMIVYNLIPEKNRLSTSPLLPILQLTLCVLILYLDNSGDNLYLALIAGICAINHAPLPQAKVYVVGALGTYLIGSTAKTIHMAGLSDKSQIVRYFFVNTLVVGLALIAFYTLKKQMVTGKRLAIALHKLQVQSEQLRDMAVINERNRIASDMHDTVGHTLTAAVLSLEAAEGLVSSHPSEATKKLLQGKEQVRRGLSELRASVRAVRTKDKIEFISSLKLLIHEICSDTGITIHSVIDSQVNLPPLLTGILLSSIKECTTNAIKHGHASQLDVLVQDHNKKLHITITDNGVGTANLQPGSGLTLMQERLQNVGGILQIDTAPGDGFTVGITIPTPQEKEEDDL